MQDKTLGLGSKFYLTESETQVAEDEEGHSPWLAVLVGCRTMVT